MNVIFDINNYNVENVVFLETKKNMLMDGIFTKIIYSDENVSINGIYLTFPISVQGTSRLINKKIIYYQTNNMDNSSVVKELANIEHNILSYYKRVNNCAKTHVYVLSDQLYCGSLKIYKETLFSQYNSIVNYGNQKYIIKISGIWENKTQYGITYKFIEATELV